MRGATLWLAGALTLAAGCTDFLSDRVVDLAKGRVEYPDGKPEPPPPPPPAAAGAVQGLLPKDPTLPFNAAKIDEAKVRTELYRARHAVKQFQMMNQENPPNLEVLGLRLKFGADLDYDAGEGRVRSRTYPQY